MGHFWPTGDITASEGQHTKYFREITNSMVVYNIVSTAEVAIVILLHRDLVILFYRDLVIMFYRDLVILLNRNFVTLLIGTW